MQSGALGNGVQRVDLGLAIWAHGRKALLWMLFGFIVC